MRTVMPFFPFGFFPYRDQPWALDLLQRLQPELAIMPTYTITSPCYHLPPLDSLSGSSSISPSVPKKAGCCPTQGAGGCWCQEWDIWQVWHHS